MTEARRPFPPFDLDGALARDPHQVALAYTEDSAWRNRDVVLAGRFQYEWHNTEGQWFRSYSNELWEFADNGLMRRRAASINDLPINRGGPPLLRPALRRGALPRTRHSARLNHDVPSRFPAQPARHR